MNRIILLIFLITAFFSNAQVDSVYYGKPLEKETIRTKEHNYDALIENAVWGGNFQMWFGNPSYFFASPSLGYKFFNRLQLGAGMIYQNLRYSTVYGTYKQAVFGAHSYCRFFAPENFFVHAQFDRLKQPDYFSPEPGTKRWVNYLIAGVGIQQPVSDNFFLTTSLMHDFSKDQLSIYPSLIFQFGLQGRFN